MKEAYLGIDESEVGLFSIQLYGLVETKYLLSRLFYMACMPISESLF